MNNLSISSLALRGAYSGSSLLCGRFSTLKADKIGISNSFGQFLSVSSAFRLSNSRLINFLSRTITVTSSIGGIWLNTSRQILAVSANVTQTTFANISGGDYGGAIESNNNYQLQVTYCVFINITSTNEGAAIYKYGGSFVLQCSTFTLCHSTYSSDTENGANSVSGFSCNSTINDTQIYNCWQSTSNAANSVYRFQNGVIIIRVINDTSSCENNGGCCGKYKSPNSGSSAMFVNGMNNQGYCIVSLWSSSMTVSYSNFINCTLQGYEFWIYQTTLTVSNSSIFGNTASSIYTSSGSIVITNCIGDNTVSGLSQTSSTVLVSISHLSHCLVQNTNTNRFTGTMPCIFVNFEYVAFSILAFE